MLAAMRVTVVCPVYNDWVCAGELCQRLAGVAKQNDLDLKVVMVDDGSRDPPPPTLSTHGTIVHLVRNLGHQRAIAIGLAHVVAQASSDIVLVMDADGEDRPEDLPQLLAGLKDASIVVAERRRRSEGLAFRFLYFFYKLLFRLATGRRIDFGNFSAMTLPAAHRLVRMPELWLHYPAAVLRSGYPLARVPIDRGMRYDGKSKMNLVALIMHGLSAVTVFAEDSLVRAVVLGTIALPLLFTMATTVVIMKLTGHATAGWATSVIGFLAVIVSQIVTMMLGGLLVVLGNRQNLSNLPLETAPAMVERVSSFPA